MAQPPQVLGGDEWRDALAGHFNGLIPDRAGRDEAGPQGWLRAARLSTVAAFHVSGTSQVLRRSPARARRRPSELLKVCIQRAGHHPAGRPGGAARARLDGHLRHRPAVLDPPAG